MPRISQNEKIDHVPSTWSFWITAIDYLLIRRGLLLARVFDWSLRRLLVRAIFFLRELFFSVHGSRKIYSNRHKDSIKGQPDYGEQAAIKFIISAFSTFGNLIKPTRYRGDLSICQASDPG